MRRALSRDFHPPAAMVPLRLRAPGGTEQAAVEGKIDTGADICAVPEGTIVDLDLPPTRVVRAAGFGGEPAEAIVYRVDLVLDGTTFHRMEALATRRHYAIVGRNVLSRLVLKIDGPGERLELKVAGRGARKPRV